MTAAGKRPRERLFARGAASAILGFMMLGGGGIVPSRPRAEGIYTLGPVANGVELKTPDGRVVFDYLTKHPDNIGLTAPSAACFHPVNTPSGERVTNIAPSDHPHHRGIFFGWQDSEFREPLSAAALDRMGPHHPLFGYNITRADFWGWGVYAPRDGRVIENRRAALSAANATHAVIDIHNDWMVGTQKYADEQDTATVEERHGVYVIDLDYHLTPTMDFVINKSAFGGVALQGRKDGDSYYATADGQNTLPDPHYSVPELNLPHRDWYDYTIRLESGGKVVGAAMIDHPSNPPSTWHNARYLWMLNPSISALGAYTIRGNTTLRLRYRVVVHDGDTPTDLLNQLSTEFRATH